MNRFKRKLLDLLKCSKKCSNGINLKNLEIWTSKSKFCSFYVLICHKAFWNKSQISFSLLNNKNLQIIHLWKKNIYEKLCKPLLSCISSFIKPFESVHSKAEIYQIVCMPKLETPQLILPTRLWWNSAVNVQAENRTQLY